MPFLYVYDNLNLIKLSTIKKNRYYLLSVYFRVIFQIRLGFLSIRKYFTNISKRNFKTVFNCLLTL